MDRRQFFRSSTQTGLATVCATHPALGSAIKSKTVGERDSPLIDGPLSQDRGGHIEDELFALLARCPYINPESDRLRRMRIMAMVAALLEPG